MTETSGKVRIALALEHALLQQGGIEVILRELIRGLADKFEIVLVSQDRTREELGAEFAPLIHAQVYWNRLKPSPKAARELASALIGHGVKLAHFHGAIYEWQCHKAWESPLNYILAQNVPCLMTDHLVLPLLEGYSKSSRFAWRKALLLPKAWLSKASLLVRMAGEFTVSKHDQKLLRSNFPPLAGKIGQMYHSRLKRSDCGLPQDKREKTIVCLGVICKRKGQTILTRAFASIAHRHPDWKLHLVGRREWQDYLDDVIATAARAGLADRVVVSPPVSNPHSVLESASIVAMPSLSEPLGLALQEALYYECACVGSAVGGIPELIEDGVTGLLIPPGDEKALAAALDRLMSEADLRTQLTKKARQSIIDKGMLSEIMVANHVRIYDAVLAGKNLREI